MKKTYLVAIIISIIFLLYALGPRPSYEKGSPTPAVDLPSITGMDAYVASKNARFDDIRTDNEAVIEWAGEPSTKTPYAIVYIHGFSASGMEGDPTHREIAQRYGYNLYIPRLRLHGRKGKDIMKDLTPDMLIDDAYEALQVGSILGDSIIVMSCSTGSTLSIINGPLHPKVAAYIMYSPNIDLYDPKSSLITKPWGEELMKIILGGSYNVLNYNKEQAKYWYDTYHVRSVIALKTMLNQWMVKEQFQKLKKPLYVGYFYKDEKQQDTIVSVAKIKEFAHQVGTPKDKLVVEAFPEATNHVICSSLFSSDYKNLIEHTDVYMQEVLGMKHTPKEKADSLKREQATEATY